MKRKLKDKKNKLASPLPKYSKVSASRMISNCEGEVYIFKESELVAPNLANQNIRSLLSIS